MAKAKKKAAKKKVAKVEAPVEVVAEEKPGEVVVSDPAIVEEATIMVRGTAMGGTRMMTPTEHKAYCAESAKKK